MRILLHVMLAACGGSAPPAKALIAATTVPPVAQSHPVADKVPIDPIAVLAPADAPVSWLVPGAVRLELGGTPIDAPGGNRPIEVTLVDRQGTLVRAVVRQEQARFSLWTERTRLLAVIAHEQRVSTFVGGDPMTQMSVSLQAGARVRKLAHKGTQTQVRFVGALEVEGWVPDDVLVEASASLDGYRGRFPTGHPTLMVTPGSVIRVEPKWTAGELATMASGYFLDSIQEVDDAWVEVAYADGEVQVHGYVSRQAPPGRVHSIKDPDVPPPTIVANAKVASGTCLYARQGGEAIGYIVGDRDVQLDDAGVGWWTLAIDTPWGPIPFTARGPTQTSLSACAPPGAVPPPAGTPPPPTAP